MTAPNQMKLFRFNLLGKDINQRQGVQKDRRERKREREKERGGRKKEWESEGDM